MAHRLDEAVLLRLERNDPDVDSLLVDGSYWTDRAGSVISDSKTLTAIFIHLHTNVVDEELAGERWRWLDKLFDALARNRNATSIGYLSYPCSLLPAQRQPPLYYYSPLGFFVDFIPTRICSFEMQE
jgi:hypothetical protein